MKITLVREDRVCPIWTVPITTDVAETIGAAVEEHHYGCEGNTCDIRHALDTGHELAAAWLLCGATEAYAVSAAIDALVFNGHTIDLSGAFDAWCDSPDSDSVRCPECDMPIYRDFEGCDSCGANLVPDLDTVLDAYVECALWSSVHFASEDDAGTPLDDVADVSDIAETALAEMRDDCQSFIEDAGYLRDLIGMDAGQIGHDFWLTRNHHGAGFWDRGLGDRGDRLTKWSHTFGESDLYLGDDGRVYVS